MPIFETRISDFILRRIRALRQPVSDVNTGSRSKLAGPVSVREARFSDCKQVCALNSRLGLGPDSPENWKRLWEDNPALNQGNNSVIGWVLETSNGIVGFLGSIPMLYEYAGRTIAAVATCRLAVETEYRPFSHLLVASFFRQKNADLFLDTTATVSAGKMMMAFKAVPLPQRDYGTVLFWVIDARAFARTVLKGIGLNSGLVGMGSIVASLIVRADAGLRARTPRPQSAEYVIVDTSVNNIGDEFQCFWSDEMNRTVRLRAKRSPAIMSWHFDPPNNRRVARVLSCYLGSRLVGYGVVRHDGPGESALRRSILADLMVEGDNPEIVLQLLAAIYKSAKDAGSHVLEVMGFPTEIREALMKVKPYARKYPACPYFYKAREKALHEKLMDESQWYACPFDGDATLWP